MTTLEMTSVPDPKPAVKPQPDQRKITQEIFDDARNFIRSYALRGLTANYSF